MSLFFLSAFCLLETRDGAKTERAEHFTQLLQLQTISHECERKTPAHTKYTTLALRVGHTSLRARYQQLFGAFAGLGTCRVL